MKNTRRKSRHQDEQNATIQTTRAEYLRLRDLLIYLNFSASTIWRGVSAGSFPKPVKLSAAVTAWKTSDIRAWMQRVEGNAVASNTAGESS
jgi:predicted DNA-binding transcriptional regulator AlpA